MTEPSKTSSRQSGSPAEVPFGSSEIRLTSGQWMVVAAVVAIVLIAAPVLWRSSESFEQAAEFRIPFDLSSDYWLYESRVQQVVQAGEVAVVGDSVIWGEYVSRSGTLPAALNQLDPSQRYANLGVSGMHPMALQGLMDHYASGLKDTRVLLHCNLLWLSSGERDLSLITKREIDFNHPALVPQLSYIPVYKADPSERLSRIVNRAMPFRKLVLHLRASAYEGLDPHTWTLEHPYDNPLGPITFTTPACDRPPRGPMAMQPSDIPWLKLEESLQWRAFKNTAAQLRKRGNRLFVVLGPYNEHQLTEQSRKRYAAIKADAIAWLSEEGIPHCAPAVLASSQYGDASHPLAEGYRHIAEQILASPGYRSWKAAKP